MEKVYLGMPESWAKDKCEESDHYTTKVGGLPDWPIPISTIISNLLICSKCGSNLCLVTQVYAPLFTDTLKIEERILYVLGCISSQCGSSQESWRVLRLQKASELACDDKSLLTFDTEDDDDDDSETDNQDMSLEELAIALTASLTLSNEHDNNNNNNKRQPKNVPKHSTTKKTMRVADKLTPVLPCFYIYAEEEKRHSKNIESLCANLASVSTKNDNGQEQEEIWEEEAYEYNRALTADRTFLKFKKRLDTYPEQCFRYSFGGSPLLASRKREDSSGSCKHCGGLRNYEMQLMSPLLFYLQEQDQKEETKEHSLDSWNWLTLIVHTCSNSCFANEEDSRRSDGWSVIEEAITVHNDDDQ